MNPIYDETGMPILYGYNGDRLSVGDRVELHPATDLWMRGARYGTIVGRRLTSEDRVILVLDTYGDRRFATSMENIRPIGV